MQRHTWFRRLAVPLLGFSLAGLWVGEALAQHSSIPLRDIQGNVIDPTSSNVPYSPKQTCGTCHDYDLITEGYHFQQGRTDASGTVQVSDSFDPDHPWILSDGMYGKW